LADPNTDVHRLEQQRRQRLAEIRALGVDPYGGRYDGTEPADSIRQRFRDGDDSQRARTAGRICLLRDIGKLLFLTLRDWTGTIQVGLSRQTLASQWDLAKLLEVGDLIGAEGRLGRTKTGEITIWVEDGGLTFLSKCLSQPPEKFHGLVDTDQRYRQRYVDLWVNPEVMDRFKRRSAILGTIREALVSRGFMEVEPPMMQALAGGAAARPFVTHHNSLDLDLYLRISPELFLLLVGGMERVYELGRVYRNEGISQKHNPEFTMLEVYQAYGNYETMMDLTEKIIVGAIQAIGAPYRLPWGDKEIDFTPPFARKTYNELFQEHTGVVPEDAAAVAALAKSLGLETANRHPDVIKSEVFEAQVEDALAGPVFVIDYPASICPLTKRKRDRPEIAERFELYVHGMEIANAYTELNDPDLQEQLFKTQLEGMPEEESMAKLDHDFIRALRHGMPPAGGLGVGIDRLVMLLTDSPSIRDVILFPLLRPESAEALRGDGGSPGTEKG